MTQRTIVGSMTTPEPRSPMPSLTDVYGQATADLRRDARVMRAHTELARDLYRARLGDWMQLRSRLDHRATDASEVISSLRTQEEDAARELGELQRLLKRLDVAARQVDLLVEYLTTESATDEVPDLDPADSSAAALSLRIIQAQEQERLRLAEEIHDGPAQVLTNAIFQVEYLDRVIADSPTDAAAELTFLRTMLRGGLDDIRGFIAALRPPAPDVGLEDTLIDQGSDFEGRHGIQVAVEVAGIDQRMGVTARTSVLRIVQEALQNIRKHAAASEVRIALEGDTLIVADNGRGFDVVRLATGGGRNFGLQFMRERAELMGAHLQIESRQGEGTRILLRLPDPVG
jgi:two-component system sensor histidine kinase DegS